VSRGEAMKVCGVVSCCLTRRTRSRQKEVWGTGKMECFLMRRSVYKKKGMEGEYIRGAEA